METEIDNAIELHHCGYIFTAVLKLIYANRKPSFPIELIEINTWTAPALVSRNIEKNVNKLGWFRIGILKSPKKRKRFTVRSTHWSRIWLKSPPLFMSEEEEEEQEKEGEEEEEIEEEEEELLRY